MFSTSASSLLGASTAACMANPCHILITDGMSSCVCSRLIARSHVHKLEGVKQALCQTTYDLTEKATRSSLAVKEGARSARRMHAMFAENARSGCIMTKAQPVQLNITLRRESECKYLQYRCVGGSIFRTSSQSVFLPSTVGQLAKLSTLYIAVNHND